MKELAENMKRLREETEREAAEEDAVEEEEIVANLVNNIRPKPKQKQAEQKQAKLPKIDFVVEDSKGQKNLAQILAEEVEEVDLLDGAVLGRTLLDEEKKKLAAEQPENDKKVDDTAKQNPNPKELDVKNADANVVFYTSKLEAYNKMYKLNVGANEFAWSVTEAWGLITSGDRTKLNSGYLMINKVFKDTLKKAFDVEKDTAYEEHRLPEYVEIVRSTNELMRSAMYGLTDMYHNPSRKNLFGYTAFGGLTAKDIGDLTTGNSLWEKDQKSDEAWDLQAKEAKDIADKWLEEDKPYEKMISEMKALVDANKEGVVPRKEILDKLTAAEWLLVNNEKMMVEDPEDPLNPIPNWGNRYWKALSETREALGISKHTSMRELIQSDYAAMAKAVGNANYNRVQIQQYVLDEDVRELSDSMEAQKETFAAQSRDIIIKSPANEKVDEKTAEANENEIRWRYPVTSEDEREKMKNEPKIFSNRVIEKTNELTIDSAKEDFR